jgi:hypothetical protein
VAPVPGLSNVATPTKAIITIPITLDGYGNGDDAEEGLPRDGVMGGSIGSTSATKPVTVAVRIGRKEPALLSPPRPRLILPGPPCSVGWSPHALEASADPRSSC